MRALKYFLLSILFLSSCDKFDWHNPYDPECPKELFTPSSPGATMEGNSVKLTWSQSNDDISGFALFRSAEGEPIANLTQTQKTATQYLDASVTPGKKYTYYVLAVAGTNKSDTIKAEITPVFPITITTGTVTDLAATSAKVSGNITNAGGGTVTSRGICWSITQNPTVSNNKTTEGTGAGQYTSTITGLIAGTTYYARAYGENSRGIVYGSQVIFTTLGPPTLTTTAVSNITATSATSGGTIISDGGSLITAKGVVWSTSPNPTIDLATKTNDGIGSGNFTSVIDGLNPNTKYYIRAYAMNLNGTSYGEQLSFTPTIIIVPNLTNGLVAYYPFDGNSNDESGNVNNATASSIIYGSDYKGVSGKAISIPSGTSGYLKTFGVLVNIANNFSISLWVNPLLGDQIKTQGVSGAENSSSQAVIHASHGANWGNFTEHSGAGIYIANNQVQVVEHSGGYVGSPLVYNANLQGWHHYVIVYENKRPSLYIDGNFIKQGLMSIYPNVHPSNGFDSQYLLSGFGRSFAPAGNLGQFNGSFDEIRIYNRVLTQEEITYLANN